MHAVVCIKQVPDTTQVSINPQTGTIVRTGIPTIINPYDLPAIEAALRLKDAHGLKVTLLTMGPPQAEKSLKEAMSYGCDNAILLTDKRFGGSDTLATTLIISTAIKKITDEINPVDLVFCGKQTIDGDTAQVGPGLARRLNYLQLTYVSKIDSFDPLSKEIVVKRHIENGHQTVKGKVPALLTILGEHFQIRRATLDQLIQTAKYKPLVWTNDDMGLDREEIGLKGSPTVVRKIFAPPKKERGEFKDNLNPEEAAQIIAGKLTEKGAI